MSTASLYIHIPFCKRKCAYCDFASFSGRMGDMDAYIQALLQEISQTREQYGPLEVPSVFVGGGTPSVVPGGDIARIIGEIGKMHKIAPDAEISIEANPGTLSAQWLRTVREAGVNRLSLGAQSFDEGLLSLLGRIHTRREIFAAVEMARAAGFANVNLDLMYALPGQTMEQWRETLCMALETGVEHISCYSLIAEEGTPLTARIRRGELSLPGDEEIIAMQRAAGEILGQGGLYRYEISNYARKGRECRHNIGYWRRVDYLGIGCAAHSLMQGRRFCNPDTLEEYFAGGREQDMEILSPEDEMEEAVMLETRMTAGIDLAAFAARYKTGFFEKYDRGAQMLIGQGLAKEQGGRFFLTDAGLDVQNAAVLALVD